MDNYTEEYFKEIVDNTYISTFRGKYRFIEVITEIINIAIKENRQDIIDFCLHNTHLFLTSNKSKMTTDKNTETRYISISKTNGEKWEDGYTTVTIYLKRTITYTDEDEIISDWKPTFHLFRFKTSSKGQIIKDNDKIHSNMRQDFVRTTINTLK